MTGLTGDPRMVEVAARSGAGLVVMHMQGTPQTMQRDPRYDDVVREVGDFLRGRIEGLVAAGVEVMVSCRSYLAVRLDGPGDLARLREALAATL